MLDYKLKIGLVPDVRDLGDFDTRKGIFDPRIASKIKDGIVKYIKDNFTDEQTSFCDMEWLNPLGVYYKNSDCTKVCEYLKSESVDAIFIINCNFGNEEACGRLAKNMGVPVLLWGPQDMIFDEDGMRYTDAQCGLFAISKQLRRYKVPFSYIENCPVESPVFADGFKKFLSVVTMVKNFKKLAITQVGTRLTPFKSVMYNELEMTEKFGFNLNNVNLLNFEKKFDAAMESHKTDLEKDLADLKEKYNVGTMDDLSLTKLLCFVYVYKEIFEETGADIVSTECWSALPATFGVNPCLAMSILADQGYPIVCESDVHGAVTNALLLSASRGKMVPLFGEFTVRHPENKNAELLWHCGPFALSCKACNSEAKIFNGKPSFRAKDGTYTISRFQGDEGKYTLLGGKFNTVDGPYTFGTYMWAEFNDMSKVEKKLINGPYIHHMSEIYDDYTWELEEFCKYIPGLEYDPIEE